MKKTPIFNTLTLLATVSTAEFRLIHIIPFLLKGILKARVLNVPHQKQIYIALFDRLLVTFFQVTSNSGENIVQRLHEIISSDEGNPLLLYANYTDRYFLHRKDDQFVHDPLPSEAWYCLLSLIKGTSVLLSERSTNSKSAEIRKNGVTAHPL